MRTVLLVLCLFCALVMIGGCAEQPAAISTTLPATTSSSLSPTPVSPATTYSNAEAEKAFMTRLVPAIFTFTGVLSDQSRGPEYNYQVVHDLFVSWSTEVAPSLRIRKALDRWLASLSTWTQFFELQSAGEIEAAAALINSTDWGAEGTALADAIVPIAVELGVSYEPPSTTTLPPTTTTEPETTTTTVLEPIVYSGSGDDVVTVSKPAQPMVAYIEGNASSRHFAVTSYDADGQSIELLVNTTDVYKGLVPIDLGSTQTTKLEIKATGKWKVEFRPLSTIESVSAPGEISGSGASVFLLEDGCSTAKITGNKAERHFAMILYGSLFPDLLVNTTDVYSGTVMVDGGGIVEVKAVGPWTFTAER